MKKQWSGTNATEFHILPQTPNGKGTQTLKTVLSKTAQAESQEVSSFPADGHKQSYPKNEQMSQLMRLWYLSHRRTMEIDEGPDQKPDV